MPARSLVFALLLAPASPGAIEITARDLDATAVEQGVAARLGTPPVGWTIAVEPGATEQGVHLRLRHDDGREIERDVDLRETDIDARSRELSAVLALLVEQAQTEPVEPPPGPPPSEPPVAEPKPPTTGWLAAIGRVGLNPRRPVAPDFGAMIGGGVWLDAWHIQPVAQVGWSRTSADALTIDGVRMGAGLLAGSDFARGWGWAGAGAIAHAMWARADGERIAKGWFAVTELVATAQMRGPWWTVALRIGVDLVTPPLVARSNDATRRWDLVRPMFAIVLGARFPPRRAR